MVRSYRNRVAALCAIAAFAALAGCGPSSEENGGDSPSELTIAILESNAVNFDPAMNSVNGMWTIGLLYDTLIQRGDDGTLQPSVATDWSTDNPLALTLNLRDDVTFSDGAPVDAEAVRLNLEAAAAKGGPLSSQLGAIENIEVIDSTSIRLELSEPNPSLLFALSGPMGMLVSPNALQSDSLATTPVGTGPFLLETAQPGQRYVFEAREDYWNAEHYHFDRVVQNVFTDAGAILNAVVSGQADIGEVPADQRSTELIEQGTIGYAGAPLNVHSVAILDRNGEIIPALGDIRVRQAMNYAIDRESIAALAGEGVGVPTAQMIKPGQVGYSESLEERYTYDPERARELLAEAGYPDGFSATMMNIALFDEPAQAATANLAAVGIEITIENVPIGQYQASIASAEYPLVFLGFGVNDPYADVRRLIVPDGAMNPFGINEPSILEPYDRATDSLDADELDNALVDVNTAIVENAWFAPTHSTMYGLAHAPSLEGVTWEVVRPVYAFDWQFVD